MDVHLAGEERLRRYRVISITGFALSFIHAALSLKRAHGGMEAAGMCIEHRGWYEYVFGFQNG
jgi:hypothetical protein